MEQQAQFATALVAVAKALTTAMITRNPLWDVCADVLWANDLSLYQSIEITDGKAIITTTLRHVGCHENRSSVEVNH